MTEPVATPAAPQAPAAPANSDAADLADLRAAFSGDAKDGPPAEKGDPLAEEAAKPPVETTDEGDEPAKDASEAEKPKAEAEKPKEKDTKLFASAVKKLDEANAKLEEARKLTSSLDHREQALGEREKVLEARAKADRDLGDVIKRDPLAAFERLGITPHELARLCMENPETHDARVSSEDRKKAESATEKRIRELEERLEREESAKKDQQVTGAVNSAKANFVSFVAERAEQYPDLADEDQEELAAVMWDLAREHHANTKQTPSFEAIAAHMQKVATEKRERKEQRRAQRSGSARSESTHQRQNGQPASPGTRSPATLTNSASTERASAPRELTKEELDAQCLAELRDAFGATG